MLLTAEIFVELPPFMLRSLKLKIVNVSNVGILLFPSSLFALKCDHIGADVYWGDDLFFRVMFMES